MALRKQEEKQRLASTASSTGQESECNNCNRIIKEDETEICCDGMCEGIFHIGCVAVSTEEHSVIHAKGNNISWFCDPCAEAVSELIAEDIDTNRKLVEMQESIDSLKREIERIRDTSSDDLETKYGIKDIKERLVKLERNKRTEEQKDKEWPKLEERLKNIEKGVKEKVTSEEVNGILKHQLQQEEGRVKTTVRKTVDEEVSKSREKNIIIYRAKEEDSNLKDANIAHDKGIIRELMEVCTGTYQDDSIEKIIRLGRKDASKTRPLLIQFKELETKKQLFKNLRKLQQAEENIKILSISHDLTPEEREENRALLAEAKEKEANEPDYIFQVRGPPWNRVIIKTKRKTD